MKLILIMTLCYKSSKYSNVNPNSKLSVLHSYSIIFVFVSEFE
jgi:hypothetical protein